MLKEEDIVKSVKENINEQIDQLQRLKKDKRAKIPKELKQKIEAQKSMYKVLLDVYKSEE